MYIYRIESMRHKLDEEVRDEKRGRRNERERGEFKMRGKVKM